MDAVVKPWPKPAPAEKPTLSDHVRAVPEPVVPKPSREEALAAVRTLIAYAGDNPDREGLRDTPKRVIDAYDELYSGYREGHSGLHLHGRALDLAVHGVPNSELYAVCKSLRDVGCGYYPENKFVHVDVRPFATGHVLWVDVSRPGQPSRYVDGWPGVAEPGEVWLGN